MKIYGLSLSVILMITFSLGCSSCKKNDNNNNSTPVLNNNRIVVISDPHLFDAYQLLVAPSSGFDQISSTNDVMLLHSKEIIDEQFRKIQELNPSILLIAGDIANNGERVNHELFHERYLSPLIAKGISVYVVPGNHDINNPNAFKYNGENIESVASVTPEEFATIYADCGFSSAISRDATTLSYSAILNDKLALVALDVCHYESGIGSLEWLSGSISDETMQWMENQIIAFKNEGREVFVMLHHSATDIFANESSFIPGFVLNDHVPFCEKLVALGVHFVFNGHFHSHDITEYNQSKLYDFSIGSLSSCACPIRILDFDENNTMSATTSSLLGWSKTFEGENFDDYANSFVYGYVNNYVGAIVEPMGIADTTILATLTQLGGDAFITHYHGDEVLSPETQTELEQFMQQSILLRPIINGLLINGMYADLTPKDLTIKFNYKTGAILE